MITSIRPIANIVYEGVKAVYGFSRSEFFPAIQQGGIGCMGAKEVVAEGVLGQQVQDTIEDLQPLKERPKKRLTHTQIHFLRGLFSMGTGFCGMIVALQHVRAVVVHVSPGMLLRIGNVLFAFANVVASYESIVGIRQSLVLMKKDGDVKRLGVLGFRSSVLGLINGGGYLLMGIFSMLGISTAVTVVLGLLAATAGGAQWFHDYMLTPKKAIAKKLAPPAAAPAAGLAVTTDPALQSKVRYLALVTTRV